VSSTESGKIVVQRHLIRDVDCRHSKASLVLVSLEEVVVTCRKIEKASLVQRAAYPEPKSHDIDLSRVLREFSDPDIPKAERLALVTMCL
jgi:hypothetical protein